MRAGTRICVQTSEGRWAMLVITQLPPGRQGTMRAHASWKTTRSDTVLNRWSCDDDPAKSGIPMTGRL